MTATPRIFDDTVKDKATEASAELASMDDEQTYGPEFTASRSAKPSTGVC